MSYTTLTERDDRVKIELTPEGREELGSYLTNPCEVFRQLERGYHAEYVWTKPHEEILANLLEDHLCNGWSMPNAEDIGALTSSPILEHDGSIYWFPEYQVESELETLLQKGYVNFTKDIEAQA